MFPPSPQSILIQQLQQQDHITSLLETQQFLFISPKANNQLPLLTWCSYITFHLLCPSLIPLQTITQPPKVQTSQAHSCLKISGICYSLCIECSFPRELHGSFSQLQVFAQIITFSVRPSLKGLHLLQSTYCPTTDCVFWLFILFCLPTRMLIPWRHRVLFCFLLYLQCLEDYLAHGRY